MAEIRSFPNNKDEFIGAEPVMKWLHGRTSGVFGAENNVAVVAVPGEMAVNVYDGVGWIANSKNNGVVWWVDEEERTNTKLRIQLDIGDSTLNRIDRVVVTWETINYDTLPTVSILKGTPGSPPSPPVLTNNDSMRQISIAQILVPAGTTAVTASNITDERLDKTVCGIVTDTVGIDTTMMFEQFNGLRNDFETIISNTRKDLDNFKTTAGKDFQTWFDGIKDVLDSDTAGKLYNMIVDLKVNLKTISVSTAWEGEETFTQTVSIPSGTAKSKVDIQPDATLLNQLIEDGVSALYVTNNNGVFTINSIGAKPSKAFTVQATVEEVEV